MCLEGSNTIAATTGAAPQTSASSALPTKTISVSGTGTTTTALSSKTTSVSGTHTTTTALSSTSTRSGAAGVGRAADALAKIVQLAGAAALLL